MLSEMVNSLEESVSEIGKLVKNGSFSFIFLVFEVENRVAFSVILFFEGFHSFSSFVDNVDEEGFEIVEVESGGWEDIKGILIFFLFLRFFFLSWLGFLFNFLLLDFKNGLDSFYTEFNFSHSLNKLRQSYNSFNP